MIRMKSRPVGWSAIRKHRCPGRFMSSIQRPWDVPLPRHRSGSATDHPPCIPHMPVPKLLILLLKAKNLARARRRQPGDRPIANHLPIRDLIRINPVNLWPNALRVLVLKPWNDRIWPGRFPLPLSERQPWPVAVRRFRQSSAAQQADTARFNRPHGNIDRGQRDARCPAVACLHRAFPTGSYVDTPTLFNAPLLDEDDG